MIAALIRWSARNLLLVGFAAVFLTLAGLYAVSRVPLERHLVQQARACGAEIETVYESDELVAIGGVAASLLPR